MFSYGRAESRLRCRADAGHLDSMGRSASYYAALHGHGETLQLLRAAERPRQS